MKLYYLPIGNQTYTDRSDYYARFVLKKQLLDAALWQKFVEVFRTREDAADHGWRGEYFGKMMRGACLTYRYLKDERLYALLEQTVRDLIATADEKGRIATYPEEHELCGWDLWCRKYVLVGCLYFYEICKDEKLKGEILSAMRCHLDAIESKIGEGKIAITATSEWYGGMNSSSILEPVVELYSLTKEPRYLALAEHILKAGGCRDGNLFNAVRAGTLPHEFPTTKAYETTSFFEGALAYYEVTGKEEYLDLAERFSDLVADNEITVIGCAGCKNEHFDHAVEKQTERYPNKYIMQETCVTVTWMRLQERLLRVTGKAKYADRIERSALNAMYGALNLYGEAQYCKEEKKRLAGVPFDSYSPLVAAPRGIGIGGYKKIASGGFYGCCACIGAAGIALYPLSSALSSEDGVTISFYHAGTLSFKTKDGTEVTIESMGDLADGAFSFTVQADRESAFTLSLRIPVWSSCPSLELNGEPFSVGEGYAEITRTWKAGDKVTLDLHPLLVQEEKNGRVAMLYGPFVLARDQAKESFFAPRKVAKNKPVNYQKVRVEGEERVRLLVTAGGTFTMTDYASCGKHWTRRRNRITVWQKQK